jgi:hypothetical protein
VGDSPSPNLRVNRAIVCHAPPLSVIMHRLQLPHPVTQQTCSLPLASPRDRGGTTLQVTLIIDQTIDTSLRYYYFTLMLILSKNRYNSNKYKLYPYSQGCISDGLSRSRYPS